MAAGSGIRIGDAEREATASSLREHYAHGRLTMEEFQGRLDAAFAAKTDVDLTKVTEDLPHVNPYAAPWPPAQPAGPSRPNAARQLGGGGRSPRGARPWPYAILGVSVAVLALFLIVVVSLPFGGLPKAVLIVFAVFAFLRRMLRRVIIGGRRGGRR